MISVIKKTYPYLRSPWAIAIALVLGIIVGLFFHDTAKLMGPWGEIYLRFLEMCIIPIVISAVISSIGKLLKTKNASKYFKKLVSIPFLGLFLASIIGISIASICRPGKGISIDSEIKLGRIVSQFEQNDSLEIAPDELISFFQKEELNKPSALTFIIQLIPQNVFSSLSEGENIKILFFSIIFGIALGFIPSEDSTPIVDLFSGVLEAFGKIIHGAIYLLPFAIVCLIANLIAKNDLSIIFALNKYIVIYFVTISAVFIVNQIFFSRHIKTPFIKSLIALRESYFICIGSANIFISLPSALNALNKELPQNQNTVNFILPIGINIFALGSALFNYFNILFIAQLLDVPISFQGYFIILVGSILCSMSTIGAPILIKLTMLSIIFTPLGIPLASAIAILMAVKPMTESFEVLLNLQGNCIFTALIAKNRALA